MREYIVIKKRTAAGCSVVAALAVIAIVAWWFAPFSKPKTTTIRTETRSYNILKANGHNALFFRDIPNDSTLTGAALTASGVSYGRELSVAEADLHRIVARYRQSLYSELKRLADIKAELHYYLDVHNVQDEGFDMVAGHEKKVDEAAEKAKRLLDALSGITETTRLEIAHRVIYTDEDTTAADKQRIFVESFGGLWTNGYWLKTTREGQGIATDGQGRTVCGIWHADTLRKGRLTDSTGTYSGEFDRNRQPSGHGSYTGADGTYYEGRWKDGRQDGFGFEVSSSHIRSGEWKDGKYKGERINYTSERIYGIDISRYQHGKGRKYYPIYWNRLRITHLGRISNKQISGAVDYPVSFVYIKSTEGTSVRNRYYAADYRQAKRHGLRCGAYHFFSTKTNAAAQARYFIKHSFFRKGDFPPVLDVEPTHSQIMQMGGVDVMFNAIRTWMKIVKRHTGIRPVLYVNQTFVNKYLSQAPDIKRDYNVWIARYGEYKPDVKLVYWQLCPDGRVEGIHGDVDINVFNGYQDRFDAFLKTERIK